MDGQTGIPTIHVYGYNLTDSKVAQIHLWKRVHYIDINMAFPDIRMYGPDSEEVVSGKANSIFFDDRLRKAILERTITDYGAAVYLSAKHIFDGYIMDRLARDPQTFGHVQITSPHDGEVVLQGATTIENLGA